MAAVAVCPDALSIDHIRLIGGAGRRGELEAGLRRLNLGDVQPPGEILIIPHLRAATPLDLSMSPSLFAARLTDQLRQTRHEAVLDPAGATPDGKVLRFSNYAGFAAWLLMAWLRPQSGQTKTLLAELLKGESVEQYQRRSILQDGRLIVRLVAVLAREGVAAQWAGRLTPEDVATAIEAVGRSFGFRPALAAGEIISAAFSVARSTVNSVEATVSKGSPTVALRSAPSPAPSRAKTSDIAALRSLTQRAAIEAGPDLDRHSKDRQALVLSAIMLGHWPNIGQLLDGIGWLSLPTLVADRPPSPPPLSQLPMRQQAREQVEKRKPGSPLAANQSLSPAAPGRRTKHPRVAEAFTLKSAVATARAADPVPILLPTEIRPFVPHFETQFGGLMFVINILLALKLYPDFAEPHGRRLAPSPFWLLAQLGLRFFGRAFRRDPLFAFLRDSGHKGSLPKRWQVEHEWFSGLPQTRRPRTSFDGEFLTQWDSRGFPLYDSPERRWSRKAITATTRYANRRLPARAHQRWIACLGDFITFRMSIAASGLHLPSLRLRARVAVSGDDVDLHFALAQLPLALRLAGLDRDPGWLPAEGRALSFHFS